MLRYLARRLFASALILLGVTVITFALSYLIPADPVRMIAGRSASAATVESIRHALGLDRPLHEQYLSYLGDLLQGDLRRRSEEHTSELQSLMRISYAVFCLKKKKITETTHR